MDECADCGEPGAGECESMNCADFGLNFCGFHMGAHADTTHTMPILGQD